jgi:hypothetical protein
MELWGLAHGVSRRTRHKGTGGSFLRPDIWRMSRLRCGLLASPASIVVLC